MQYEQDAHQYNNPDNIEKSITINELIEEFERIIEGYYNLPKHAQFSFVTHADLHYYLIHVINILKACVNK